MFIICKIKIGILLYYVGFHLQLSVQLIGKSAINFLKYLVYKCDGRYPIINIEQKILSHG